MRIQINLEALAIASMALAATYYILHENARAKQSHDRWMDMESQDPYFEDQPEEEEPDVSHIVEAHEKEMAVNNG